MLGRTQISTTRPILSPENKQTKNKTKHKRQSTVGAKTELHKHSNAATNK